MPLSGILAADAGAAAGGGALGPQPLRRMAEQRSVGMIFVMSVDSV
jgi:hypothetical protein